MSRISVVLNGPAVAGRGQWLAGELGTAFEVHELDAAAATAADAAVLAGAAALVTVAFDHRFPPTPALRLVQVPGVGCDLVELAALPPRATLCNVRGHSAAVAEYVILQLLEWRHRTREAEALFRRGDWRRSSRLGAAPHGELEGARIGIVGYGEIGRALARRLAAFGVEIHVSNRTAPASLDGIASFRPLDALDDLMAEVDFAVLAIAATPETIGLIGRSALDALGPEGVLVNVARGAVVDEAALFESLRSGRLGGAILDVWYSYPDPAQPTVAPSRFPFAELPNAVMTPHMSGWTKGTVERRWRDMADNLRRLGTGEPFRNVVHPPRSESTAV